MVNQSNQTVFSCECEKCGRTLYEGEMLNIRGKYVCEPCADTYIFGSGARVRRAVPSPFFNFIFSLHPGAGHMYQGLMKRGLFQMCLFYICIFLTSTAMPEFFGLTIPIIWMYSFFDSLSLRRRAASGEAVGDDLGDVTLFFSRYKSLVVIALVIMFVMGAVSSFFSAVAVRSTSVSSAAAPADREISFYISEGGQETLYEIQQSIERTAVDYRGPHKRSGILAPIAIIGIGGLILMKSKKGKSAKVDVIEAELPERDGYN